MKCNGGTRRSSTMATTSRPPTRINHRNRGGQLIRPPRVASESVPPRITEIFVSEAEDAHAALRRAQGIRRRVTAPEFRPKTRRWNSFVGRKNVGPSGAGLASSDAGFNLSAAFVPLPAPIRAKQAAPVQSGPRTNCAQSSSQGNPCFLCSFPIAADRVRYGAEQLQKLNIATLGSLGRRWFMLNCSFFIEEEEFLLWSVHRCCFMEQSVYSKRFNALLRASDMSGIKKVNCPCYVRATIDFIKQLLFETCYIGATIVLLDSCYLRLRNIYIHISGACLRSVTALRRIGC